MNEITMLTNADPLIRMALDEDITSEDISTNAVMREAKQGEVKDPFKPHTLKIQIHLD